MSFSPEVGSAECKTLLEVLLRELGAAAIDETLFDPEKAVFASIHNTTWDEIEREGWIEVVKDVGEYRFTGTGWLGALQATGSIYERQFEERMGSALGAMKRYVKGRDRPALVPLRQIADAAKLPEGLCTTSWKAGC